ncbi:MAG: zinc-dependent alcohol dehydrogenase family protein [Candidatus Schekmanbacteria bacterium]|nr:zinc-dependent alcohol dehydrogenase family protein [Candidatus Schekmanbacteria bacterium]
MTAAILARPGERLALAAKPIPSPAPGQVLLEVLACGLCRTDLHIVDGELPNAALPLVLGHQIVGRVAESAGPGSDELATGTVVGVPWLAHTCGRCDHCARGNENLCDGARFTGYDRDGGLAEYAVAEREYCFPIPPGYPPLQAAPLLCAGLIGYRALRMTGNREAAPRIGLYGFGAAAHIVCQVAIWERREVFGFVRSGDERGAAFARELGAVWVGSSLDHPPVPLDAAIIFAPVGNLVPAALAAVRKGGRVICAGIHMSDIPSFPYSLLWGERCIQSVANLTRRDGSEFLTLAPTIPVRTAVTVYPLGRVNEALADLRAGGIDGAAVVDMHGAAET